MLIGIAVGLLVTVIALAIPVKMSYRVIWRRSFQANMTVHCLFGLVRLRFSPETTDPGQNKDAAVRSQRPPARRKTNPTAALRQKVFRRRLFRFARDLWHAVHKQHVVLHIRIGLGDPADTGQLWAAVGPLSGMLATVQGASIEIEPEFSDAVFELDSSGKLRLIPLQLIYIAFGLLLSPVFWRGVKQMRNAAR